MVLVQPVGRNKLAQFRHRGSAFAVGLPELRKLVPAYANVQVRNLVELQMSIVGRRYDTGEVVRLEWLEGRIASVTPADDSDVPWLAPGRVDLQINGFCGHEFNDLDLTIDKVRQVTLAFDEHGVTSYLPTMTTHSFEVIGHAMKTIVASRREYPDVAARIPGFHLEGPYISSEDGPRGAHPLEHCRPPCWDEFCRWQDAAEGLIRILTLAPEYPGSAEFIGRVAQTGVVVAIGHTAANSDQIRAAVDAGASMSTHLGNGAHGQIRRHPNYLWDQLADDRLIVSLIVDGHHLPPEVVKTFVRAKSPQRCVLVSDIVGMAGMPPGAYPNTSVGSIEILIDGRIVVAGQRQLNAGAALPLTVGVAKVIRFGEVSLFEAIQMASSRPAELIGERPNLLRVGDPADLITFDLPGDDQDRIMLRSVIKSGEKVGV